MKQIFFIALTFTLALTSLAQDCKNYFFLVDNSEIEMTLYDKKGNVNGKNIYKISDVKKEASSFSSVFNVNGYDSKGKTTANGKGKVRCNGGAIDVDMSVFMPGEQMEAYKNMDVRAEEAYLNYPASLSTGQSLADGKFNMEIINNGAPFSTVNYDILNRKVEAKESVTTSAGTWECYKITYDGAMNIRTMGIGIPVNIKAVEWFVPGFGVVKSETYNKNGKLMGSTALTSIKK